MIYSRRNKPIIVCDRCIFDRCIFHRNFEPLWEAYSSFVAFFMEPSEKKNTFILGIFCSVYVWVVSLCISFLRPGFVSWAYISAASWAFFYLWRGRFYITGYISCAFFFSVCGWLVESPFSLFMYRFFDTY